MHDAVLVFLVGLMLTGSGACFRSRLRMDLLRPGFWLALAAAAGACSAASLLASASRRAGTGITTSYGWPKSFYFRYVSEIGERSDGYSLIYFAGNLLALAGALLIAWTGWRLIRP
jgi:hypothetical protein